VRSSKAPLRFALKGKPVISRSWGRGPKVRAAARPKKGQELSSGARCNRNTLKTVSSTNFICQFHTTAKTVAHAIPNALQTLRTTGCSCASTGSGSITPAAVRPPPIPAEHLVLKTRTPLRPQRHHRIVCEFAHETGPNRVFGKAWAVL
jgi:hypothetical protein